MTMLVRRSQQTAPEGGTLLPSYEAEIRRLETRLADLVAETEALARIRFLEWKIRKAEERKVWLTHGVTFPQSPHDHEQDGLFSAMEHRMRQEEEAAFRRVEEAEKEEQHRLEAQQREQRWEQLDAEQKTKQAQKDAEQHALEVQRIEAQQQIAETIARALKGDLER